MAESLYDIIKETQEYGNSFIITSKNKLEQVTEGMKLKKKVSKHIEIYESSKDKEKAVYILKNSKDKIELDSEISQNIHKINDIKYIEFNDITLCYERAIWIKDEIAYKNDVVNKSNEDMISLFSKITEEILIRSCKIDLTAVLGWFKSTRAKKITIEKCDFTSSNELRIHLFKEATEIEDVTFRDNIFKNINTISYLFNNCNELRRADISNNIYGANIETSNHAFRRCLKLKEIIGLDTIDFSYCWEMNNMFSGCSNLKSIRLSFKNKTSCSSLSNAFERCYVLQELILDNFDFKEYCRKNLTDEISMLDDVPFDTNISFTRQLDISDIENNEEISILQNWLNTQIINNEEQIYERNYTSKLVKRITVESIKNNINTFKLLCYRLLHKTIVLSGFGNRPKISKEYIDEVLIALSKFKEENAECIISKITECNDTIENWYKGFNIKQSIIGMNLIILDLAICIMVIDCDNADYIIYLVDR